MADTSGGYISLADAQTAMDLVVQKAPGVVGILHLSVLTEEGLPRSQDVTFPASWITDKKEYLVRCCAAHMNNLAMTFGGTEIECASDFNGLAGDVMEAAEQLFPQIRQVLSDYCERPISIRSVRTHNALGEPPSDEPKLSLTARPGGGIALGVNIDQTLTKMVFIADELELTHTRVVVPTWREGAARDFASLFGWLGDAIHDAAKQFGLPLKAIGVCVGGIVRDGRITTRSGVAAQMPESDFPAFRDIASRLAERFAASTLLCQDVIAKAYAIKLTHPCNVLVLDIGTSTGGAFVAADGRLPDYINQVGRVVLDISSTAASRDDGQARGVLSKYLSITGYERLCREHGLAGHPIDAILGLAEAGDARAAKVNAQLAKILRDTIRTLNRYYAAPLIVLTGGFIQTPLGSKLIDEENLYSSDRGERIPHLTKSANPLFEGAVGAAMIAAKRVGAIESAKTEVRRSLARAEVSTSAPFSVPPVRRVQMNSLAGLGHYINYNTNFIRRYVAYATADLNFRSALVAKLILETSNLERVGALTPQQVQTAVVRAVALATERHDLLLPLKRKTNLAVKRWSKDLAVWLERHLQRADQIDYSSAALLRALLVISGLLNASDFFQGNAVDEIAQALFADRSEPHSDEDFSMRLQNIAEELVWTHASPLLALDDFEAFYDLLRENPGGSVLYFMDNAGEAIIDLLAAEVLLMRGYRVVFVGGSDPFVDDVTISEVRQLVYGSTTMANFARTGQLQFASADSDMTSWSDTLFTETGSAAGFIAKGMRKLGQLYKIDWRLCGLHVTLNKSDTIRRLLRQDRGIFLSAENNKKVVLFYSDK